MLVVLPREARPKPTAGSRSRKKKKTTGSTNRPSKCEPTGRPEGKRTTAGHATTSGKHGDLRASSRLILRRRHSSASHTIHDESSGFITMSASIVIAASDTGRVGPAGGSVGRTDRCAGSSIQAGHHQAVRPANRNRPASRQHRLNTGYGNLHGRSVVRTTPPTAEKIDSIGASNCARSSACHRCRK